MEIPKNLNSYLHRTITCDCGHSHTTTLSDILIEEGAIGKLPDLIQKYGYQKIFLISDIHTDAVAGARVKALLKENAIACEYFIFPEEELVPDETAVGKLLIHCPDDCDLVVSVGSGTLNDLGKFVSHKLHCDYFIVGTAPSMDGYASNVSPLIVNHLKTTYETHIPKAIIGDLDILKDAPAIMIAAGVGDILGKYICLIDWKVANLIQGEYYCPYVVDMVRSSIKIIAENASKIENRDPKTIGAVMEGLILSGIAMSYIGNSRPASGSEHHMSHFWEMMFLFEEKPAVLHGIKVGIGTLAAAKMYELLKNTSLDLPKAESHAKNFTYSAWEKSIQEAYGPAAGSVIRFEKTARKNDPDEVLKRLPVIQKNWDTIQELLEEALPDIHTLTAILQAVGAPLEPSKVGVDENTFRNSILYAKDLRNRYGLLQLLFDLGIQDEWSDKMSQLYY